MARDFSTQLAANYLLQTNDEPPAFISVKTSGWRTGPPEILEKLQDPAQADGVNPTSYKFRLNLELESGDDRYSFVNTLLWIGSGCCRGMEGTCIDGPTARSRSRYQADMTILVIYDTYRVL